MFKKLIGGLLFLLLIGPGAAVYAQDNGIAEGNTSKSSGNYGNGLTTGELSGVLDTDQKVTDFINKNRMQFGVQNKTEKLKLTKKTTNKETNKKHYLYQLTHKGIPVYGNYAQVHLNDQSRVYAVDNDVEIKAIDLPTSPRLSGSQAIANLTAAVEKELGEKIELESGNEIMQVKEPSAKLIIYPSNGKDYLVYETKISFLKPTIGEWVGFVDAHTGQIVEKYNALKDSSATQPSKEKKTPLSLYTVEQGKGESNNGDVKTLNIVKENGQYLLVDTTNKMVNDGAIITGELERFTENGNFIIGLVSSDTSYFTDKHAVDAHYNADVVYDYYKEELGRDSIDGKGMDILSVVHYRNLDGSPIDNASWFSDAMWYGDGSGDDFNCFSCSLDVVGHELTHGVIEKTANLEYWGQSGALNESFADIIGSLIDGDWEMGEDTGTVIRDMENPNLYDQPKHMDEYKDIDWDNGGVHINSGIPNFAAYQLATSLDQRGLDGKRILGHIAYNSLNDYLLKPTSQFLDARNAFLLSVDDLTFLESNQKDIVREEVENAWAAVGLPFGEQALIGLEMSESSLNLNVGETHQLTLTAVYSDGTREDVTSLSNWQSENPDIATVEAGLVRKINDGETTIWASYQGLETAVEIEQTPNVKGKVSVNGPSEGIGEGDILIESLEDKEEEEPKRYLFEFDANSEFSFYLKPGEYKILDIFSYETGEYIDILDKKFTVGKETLQLDVDIPPVTVTGKIEFSDPDILEQYDEIGLILENNGEDLWIDVKEESYKGRLSKGTYNVVEVYAYTYDDSLEKLIIPLHDSIKITDESKVIEKNIKANGEASFLHVDSVKENSTAVTGGTDPNKTIEIYNESSKTKTIGKGKSKSDGHFSVKIPKQKLGTILTVVVKDAHGNLTAETKIEVQDGTPPEAPKVDPVTDQSKNVQGTTEAHAIVTVRAGTEHYTGEAGENGHFSVAIDKLKAGTTIFVTAADEAENVSKETKVVVLDGTAPDAPTVDIVKELQKAVTGMAEPGMTVTVSHNGKVLKSGKADKNGKFSVSVKMPAKGSKLFVTVKDAAGNESEATEATVLDGIAPDAPKVNPVTDQSDAVTGTTEANATVTVKAGTEQYTGEADEQGAFDVAVDQLKAGTTIVVTAADEAENVSKETKVVVADGTAPDAPTIDPVKELQKAVTGTTEPGMTVTVSHNGKVLKSGKSDKNGKFSVSVKMPAKGSKLFVTVKDAAGNESKATEATVLDGIAPEAPKVTVPVNDQSEIVTGTAEEDATVRVTIKVKEGKQTVEQEIGRGIADAGVFTVEIATQPAGTTIYLTAIDADGNVSKETKVVVSDVTAPLAPEVDDITSKHKVVTGTTEPNVTVTVKNEAGKVLRSGKSNKEGDFKLSISPQSAGSKIFVTATDSAKNTSEATVKVVSSVAIPALLP
ncbi:Ig-like domain-containing protein [Bacillus sp. 37MA]|uniref:Ig-like domain-containing protein n=1 Tax=Bacillus sp. 37MA TaxID=1132442 RepID=UPI00037DC91C|nr:Ig-like domain-containing protein [Bacillus sp. 37MA]